MTILTNSHFKNYPLNKKTKNLSFLKIGKYLQVVLVRDLSRFLFNIQACVAMSFTSRLLN